MTRFPTPRPPRSDSELLAAFAADRDEAAFAELVRRHARLVWSACRRHLPDRLDAEDAFQATFLVLVRRAGTVAGRGTVGPWLHRTAVYTARDLRRRNAVRLARTRPLPADVPAPPPAAAADLDAALLSLPERYRAPLVLCYLEGLTQREAAARLGSTEGTVSSYVSRGLAKLRDRLPREPLLAAAPAGLAASAARAAVAFRAASAAPSESVSRLVEGVLRMFWVKKATAAGLATMLALAAGFGLGVGTRHAPATAADDPPKAVEKPKADDAKRLEMLQKVRDKLAEKIDQYERELARATVVRDMKTEELKPLREQAAFLDEQIRTIQFAARTDRLEVVVAGRAGPSPFTLTERDADGGVESNTTCRNDAVLRRHLARAKADPKGPREVLVTVSETALPGWVTAALDAAKAAGFAGGRVALHAKARVRLTVHGKQSHSLFENVLTVDDFANVKVVADPAGAMTMKVGDSLVIRRPEGIAVVRARASGPAVSASVEPVTHALLLAGVSAGTAKVTMFGPDGEERTIEVTVER